MLSQGPDRDAKRDTTAELLPSARLIPVVEVALLMLLFFVYAADLTPMVNEAHYLVKAKNFWQPEWCQHDLFTASGKAHTTFYALLGWPTQFVSLGTTAWIGRLVGWFLLAIGLQRLCQRLLQAPLACLGVAVVWIAGVEHGNLAGEWVVGGVEAKVPAYGFVLMALAEMVDRRWQRVWPLLGIASAFHVLSGGWSVVAAAVAWWLTERRQPDRQTFFAVPLFVGGAIALLGLVPAVWLTVGVSAEDSTRAAHVYSFMRIKHHLLPSDFRAQWFLRHAALIATVGGLWIVSGKPIKWRLMANFTFGAIVIAAGGLIIGCLPPYAPDLAAKLLRYYWFRLTDAIVPLMLGLLVMQLVLSLGESERRQRLQQLAWGLLILATLLVGRSSLTRSQLGVPPSVSNRLLGRDVDASYETQQQVWLDWQSVCRWVKESTPEDEILLTPRHQQTFKWYAHRAEVVNWKDVPQDAISLKEWQRRFDDVFPQRLGRVRVTIRYIELRRYRAQYGVRFMVVDRRVTGEQLPLVRVYPVGAEQNATYAVYELPR